MPRRERKKEKSRHATTKVRVEEIIYDRKSPERTEVEKKFGGRD